MISSDSIALTKPGRGWGFNKPTSMHSLDVGGRGIKCEDGEIGKKIELD